MTQALDILRDIAAGQDGFVELRYHAKTSRSIGVDKGKVERSQIRHRKGVGVRVFEAGGWGFASTGSLDAASIRRAIDTARAGARSTARAASHSLTQLPQCELARGVFDQEGLEDVAVRTLEEKIGMAAGLEARVRGASSAIRSASCTYNEIFEEKAIVTTDGAAAAFRLVRPELRVQAVAEKDGQLSTGSEAVGATGGWDCLFRGATGEALAARAARLAQDLLSARHAEGGRSVVILAPSIVGLLVHEAIGHTVEADFVQAGSVAAGKIGQRVASELVTLRDSGVSEHYVGAGGTIPVDDEGVVAGRTTIIENGRLVSYLHNRESAAKFGVTPTGNARAWEYSDQPLIRMRNTYLEPGDKSLDEIIADTADGYLLEGPRNGQADATGEFMFGVQEAYRIRNGKLGELVRGMTLSGIAFDVLGTVDAVSRDFRWDLGAGYCGKGQPAKVDAGGPYVRCRALLGGEQ
ncbi:MAG TPA: TldD/PmbA family protein [Candidatus Limnocylindrales bacterium]|nr:TldD/PmbA family protein [Candidatus Limnocylindrales bacterium]